MAKKAKKRKTGTGRAAGGQRRGECKVSGCGRPAYARELCQTHHRQLQTLGKVLPIRPYRPRISGTMKFSGLRLTPRCVELLKSRAESRDLSYGATIAEILEGWYEDGAKPPPPTPHGSGGGSGSRSGK
jgi:hypothetical protein